MNSLYQCIDAEAISGLTKALIAFKSLNPPGDVDSCAVFIRDWFIRNGIDAEIKKYAHVSNVTARVGRPDKTSGKRVLWNGHFDVVPPGDLAQWDMDPFAAIEKDGCLYGRGASDMKSGIAAMMLGMKAIRESGADIGGEIVFQGIGDEETGSEYGTRRLLAEEGAVFDAAIITEPTDFCIESAQRGLRWFEIKITGKAAHAGRPHIGKNAIEHAAKIIRALKTIKYSISNELFEEGLRSPSLSVNMIEGGIKENVIAETCTMRLDRRLMPGETDAGVLREIRAAVNAVQSEGFVVDVSKLGYGWNPFVTDPATPILRHLIESFESVTGTAPVIRGKGGCTDASHISDAGIPVVIFGPGSANDSHTANEKVEIHKMVDVCKIIVDATLSYLKEGEKV